MIELNEDNLSELLEQNEKTIVMYGAPWCGNCRILKPKFKKLSTENEGVNFVYVNAEAYPNSRGLSVVKNLPTITAFNGTENIGHEVGNKVEVIQSVLGKL